MKRLTLVHVAPFPEAKGDVALDMRARPTLLGEVATALGIRFLVADFAVLQDGSISLLETNPGHASGWCHLATFVGAYAPFFRSLTGAPPQTPGERTALAHTLGYDTSPEGLLFGYFDE